MLCAVLQGSPSNKWPDGIRKVWRDLPPWEHPPQREFRLSEAGQDFVKEENGKQFVIIPADALPRFVAGEKQAGSCGLGWTDRSNSKTKGKGVLTYGSYKYAFLLGSIHVSSNIPYGEPCALATSPRVHALAGCQNSLIMSGTC
jgi:hypothetical protein